MHWFIDYVYLVVATTCIAIPSVCLSRFGIVKEMWQCPADWNHTQSHVSMWYCVHCMFNPCKLFCKWLIFQMGFWLFIYTQSRPLENSIWKKKNPAENSALLFACEHEKCLFWLISFLTIFFVSRLFVWLFVLRSSNKRDRVAARPEWGHFL